MAELFNYLSGSEPKTDGQSLQGQLGLSVEVGSTIPQQQSAKILQLQLKTGLPEDLIKTNMEDVEREVARADFDADRFRAESPLVSQWLEQNPHHSSLVGTDTGFWGGVEGYVRSFSEAWANEGDMHERNTLLLKELDGGVLSPVERARAEKLKGDIMHRARKNMDESTPEYVGRVQSSSIYQLGMGAYKGVEGAAYGGAAGAVLGAPTGLGVAATIPTGALVGSTMAYYKYTYDQEAPQAFDEFRGMRDISGQPIPDNISRFVAKMVGHINAGIEVAGAGAVASLIPGARKVINKAMGKEAAKAAVVDVVKAALSKPTALAAVAKMVAAGTATGVVEGAEEFFQAMVSAGGREVAQAASGQAFFADDVGEDVKGGLSQAWDAFVGVATTLGVGVGAINFRSDIKRARQAERAQAFYQSLADGSTSAKSFSILPEKTRELVDHITKDGPLENVYIDVPQFVAYWQNKNIDPREVAREIYGSTQQYDDALQHGGQLEIPTGVYAQKIAGTEHAGFFVDELRHAPDAMNGREAKEMVKDLEAKVKEHQDEVNRVTEEVSSRLQNIGYQKADADSMAQQMGAFFKTQADRLGISDPLSLFERYGVNIAKHETLPEDAIQQRAKFDNRFKRLRDRMARAASDIEHPLVPVEEGERGGMSRRDFLRNTAATTLRKAIPKIARDTIVSKAVEKVAKAVEPINKGREIRKTVVDLGVLLDGGVLDSMAFEGGETVGYTLMRLGYFESPGFSAKKVKSMLEKGDPERLFQEFLDGLQPTDKFHDVGIDELVAELNKRHKDVVYWHDDMFSGQLSILNNDLPLAYDLYKAGLIRIVKVGGEKDGDFFKPDSLADLKKLVKESDYMIEFAFAEDGVTDFSGVDEESARKFAEIFATHGVDATDFNTMATDIFYQKADRLKATGTMKQWINRYENTVDWNGIFNKNDPQEALRSLVFERVWDKTNDDVINSIVEVDLAEYLENQARNANAHADPQVQQAVEIYLRNPKRAVKQINDHVRNERTDALGEWVRYIADENAVYAADPFFMEWVWDGITENLTPTRPNVPFALDRAVLAAVYERVTAEPTNSKFSKVFAQEAEKIAAENAKAGDQVMTNSGKVWVKVEQTAEDDPEFNSRANLIRSLSCSTWCTSRGMERSYLQRGDFWILRDDGVTKMAIRFDGTGDRALVGEIQGPKNNGSIPTEHIKDVQDLVNSNQITLGEITKNRLKKAIEQARKEAVREQRLAKLKTISLEEAVKRFGLVERPDGGYVYRQAYLATSPTNGIAELKRTVAWPLVKEVRISPNLHVRFEGDEAQHIQELSGGSFDINGPANELVTVTGELTALQGASLQRLTTVGSLNVYERWGENRIAPLELPSLVTVGDLSIRAPVSAPNLRQVNNLTISMMRALPPEYGVDLPELRSVLSDVEFYSYVELPNLEHIGRDLALHSLGAVPPKVKVIGRNFYDWTGGQSAGHIEFVGGNTKIHKDVGQSFESKIKEIGGFLDIRGDIGKLQFPELVVIGDISNMFGRLTDHIEAGGFPKLVLNPGPSDVITYFQSAAPAPVFYSGLAERLQGVKMESAPASQWAKTINNLPGIKGEELFYSGVEEFLAEQGNNKITKADLIKMIEVNMPQVKIKDLVDPSSEDQAEFAKAYANDEFDYFHRAILQNGWVYKIYRDAVGIDAIEAMPEDERVPAYDRWKEENQDVIERAAYEMAYQRGMEEYEGGSTKYESYVPPADIRDREGYKEFTVYVEGFADDFVAPHFDEHGRKLVAHARSDLRAEAHTGGVVYQVIEAQSDLHQKAREIRARAVEMLVVGGTDRKVAEKMIPQNYGYTGGLLAMMEHMRVERVALDDLPDFYGRPENGGSRDVGVHIAYQVKNDRLDQNFTPEEVSAPVWLYRRPDMGHWAAIYSPFATEEDVRKYAAESIPAWEQIPDAPFKGNGWPLLLMKHMIRDAVIRGADYVALPTGAEQIEMYPSALRKRFDYLGFKKLPGGRIELEGTDDGYTQVLSTEISMDNLKFAFPQASVVDAIREGGEKGVVSMKASPNEEVLGKKWMMVEGDNKIEFHEPGMGSFYERTLPNILNEYFKKMGWDTKVGLVDVMVSADSGEYTSRYGFKINDRMRQQILNKGQPLFQVKRKMMQEGVKGFINIGPDRKINIGLMEQADLSTFLHESGHLYLEVLRDLSSESGWERIKQYLGQELEDGERRAQMKEDAAVIAKWLEADNLDDLSREQHEKFARGIEAYFMEGRAPSVELRSAFARFRAWLMALYHTLTGLNVRLNDDVRRVFDRLFATDQEIENVKREGAITRKFLTPEQAQMSEIEFKAYSKLVEAASIAEQERLQRKIMRQIAREHQAKWKEERDLMQVQAEAELLEQRGYAAVNVMGADDMKLSKAGIEALYPGNSDVLEALRRFGVYSDNGTLMPADAAQMLGYSSADEMINEITGLRPLAEASASIANQRMRDKYGDITIDGSLADKAREAVVGPERSHVIEAELKALRRAQRQAAPAVRAVVREARDARRAGMAALSTSVPSVADARAAARSILARVPYRSIMPNSYLSAMRHASDAVTKAVNKGDWMVAAYHSQQELLNTELYREAIRIKADVEDIVSYLRKFDRSSTRHRLGMAGETYLEQIDAIRERFDFSRMSTKEAEKRKDLAQWINEQNRKGVQINLPEDIINEAYRKSYKLMTYDEIVGVRDSVKHIAHLARTKNRLLKSKAARELSAVTKLLEETAAINARYHKPIERETRLPQGAMKRTTDTFLGGQRKISSLAREMDGFKDGGPWWTYVIWPLNDAASREAKMHELANAKIAQLFAPYLGLEDKMKTLATTSSFGLVETGIFKKEFIPEINGSLSKVGQIMVALNWGNEDNRQRILQMYDQAGVEAILDRLDQTDWGFVQGVWDYIDSYWPEIEAMAKRVDGIAPKKVEALPVNTKFGQIRGGYFPLVYDDRQSPRAYSNVAKEQAERAMRGAAIRATTAHGHRMERVDNVKMPVRLDFGVIFEHLNNVIHDLTHFETLIDINRILGHPVAQKAVVQNFGDIVYKQFRSALSDVAAGNVVAQTQVDKALNWIKNGAAIVGMGWKISTGLLQPLGLTQSMVRIGPKWVAKGVAHWLGDAARMNNTTEFIYSKSDLMQERSITQVREINEIRNQVVPTGALSPMRDTYFYLIIKLQQVADIPTWLGQYEKSMEELGYASANSVEEQERIEAKAVALADQAVLDSQGSGMTKDQAALYRGGPAWKLWTLFGTFFNATYNVMAEQYRQTNFKSPQSVAKLAADMILLFIVPAILSTLVRDGLRGDLPDDPEDLLIRMGKESASYALGTVVLLREIGGVMQGFHGWSGPPGAAIFKHAAQFAEQAQQGDLDEALFKSGNYLAGTLFHYPAGQIQKSVEGFTYFVEHDSYNPLPILLGPPREN